MTAATGQALEMALAVYRAPTFVPAMRARPLPDDVISLLHMVAGDETLVDQAAHASGETPAHVIEAATFFILQVLFDPASDSYRVLGVAPGAPDARIKEHYRWLVRWLHPDRNPDGWQTAYADRINRAWQDLRLPERRQAYDADRSEPEQETPHDNGPHRTLRPVMMDDDSPVLVSARATQLLPQVVFGSLGAIAGAVLVLMWYANSVKTVPVRVSAAPPELVAEERPEVVMTDEAADVSGPAGFVSTPAEASPEAQQDLASDVSSSQTQPPTQTFPTSAPVPDARVDASAVALANVPALRPQVARGAQAQDPPQIASRAAARNPVQTVSARETNPMPAAAAPTIVAAAPTSNPASGPPADATRQLAAPVYSEAAANDLLRRFSNAYAAGDINALMHLFTRDARNNRGGRDAIVYDYQSLFSRSSQRVLQLQPTGWMQRADGATVLARYQASVTVPGRRRPDLSDGSIRFELRDDNGILRIAQVHHDND